ncbi:MAG: hypothetical protein CME62_06185 [Halobacteriovoraceae bacterium]|nr:hypothetical protein [Halobacteriovoraceae bacterium]|tara:strand:- start:12297 stop:12755 length:459 start_codon:yes stop_codon:yes gene_type:complete
MLSLIVFIWILQGMAMFVDEFYFHHKRGLGAWERIGHPIDTLFFVSCFIFTLFLDASAAATSAFVILGLMSTLIIVKDEFVHAKECDGGEHLLHAFLFILHPCALIGLYWMWQAGQTFIIGVQTLIISLFMIYQVVYWNFAKGKKYEQFATS